MIQQQVETKLSPFALNRLRKHHVIAASCTNAKDQENFLLLEGCQLDMGTNKKNGDLLWSIIRQV